jgi:hypothetical protein
LPDCFPLQDFDSFVRGTFTSSARATMEGAYQNYGQQFVLLPMYTQYANMHIALLRNVLWGPRELLLPCALRAF